MKISAWSPAVAAALVLAACAAPGPPDPADMKFSFAVGERRAIHLSSDERAYMLAEMRLFLDTMTSLADALSRGDTQTVSALARTRGFSATANRLPEALEARLPQEFRLDWINAQLRLESLGDSAQRQADTHELLRDVGLLLGRCNGCHMTYEFR